MVMYLYKNILDINLFVLNLYVLENIKILK